MIPDRPVFFKAIWRERQNFAVEAPARDRNRQPLPFTNPQGDGILIKSTQ
ncbi:hypothetical protein HMPREF0262_03613 [Clostridium sp. ATCC 29733]|nr:hypothetical protein HMPREF0262_03613 [Clostridium sp. ATCC 29733]